jgi:hypothetical protein
LTKINISKFELGTQIYINEKGSYIGDEKKKK